MGIYLLLLCSAAGLGISVPAVAHDPEQSTRPRASASLPLLAREVAAVVYAFHYALRKGNRAAVQALLADDAIIFKSGGAERSKAEFVEHHLPADVAFSRATRSITTRRSQSASGNLAWVATESSPAGSFEGLPINSVATETMVLRRTGATWRIAHIQ